MASPCRTRGSGTGVCGSSREGLGERAPSGGTLPLLWMTNFVFLILMWPRCLYNTEQGGMLRLSILVHSSTE